MILLLFYLVVSSGVVLQCLIYLGLFLRARAAAGMKIFTAGIKISHKIVTLVSR